jgi:hypothetical protein
LGIGDWGLGPIPNPQSPIPNPQSPIPNINHKIYISSNELEKYNKIILIKLNCLKTKKRIK